MTVGMKIEGILFEIGLGSFLHAFFSTVSANLETNGWGTRFPKLLNGLYQGHLPKADVPAAIDELRTIRSELSALSPEHVVWDIENRDAQPPWGDAIADSITDLGNYFVTSGGRDLITTMDEMLVEADRIGSDVGIE